MKLKETIPLVLEEDEQLAAVKILKLSLELLFEPFVIVYNADEVKLLSKAKKYQLC
jgi:hypothetical protein